MATYTSQDLAATFGTFRDYMGQKIDELERIDNLPFVRMRSEVVARQRAVQALRPIHEQFAQAAARYHREAEEVGLPTEAESPRFSGDEYYRPIGG